MEMLRAGAIALALAVAPVAASSATMVTDGGGPYDLLADMYKFEGDFVAGTAGDTLTFSFVNSSNTTAAVTFFGITLNQLSAAFTDGVQLTFGPIIDSFGTTSVGEQYSFLVDPNQVVNLAITFGNVFDTIPDGFTGQANIDFQVTAAAVPLPAAGFLLLGALGGLAALRRRKST
jgi:hypothetical protein